MAEGNTFYSAKQTDPHLPLAKKLPMTPSFFFFLTNAPHQNHSKKKKRKKEKKNTYKCNQHNHEPHTYKPTTGKNTSHIDNKIKYYVLHFCIV
jgi:hypothetical protein